MAADTPLAVLGAGLVSGIGLTAAESCAAIRCGINNFQDTRFYVGDGDWLVGSPVTLESPWRGISKLAKMAARAIAECLADPANAGPEQTLVLLCVAEPERPGRIDRLSRDILRDIERELGVPLHPRSQLIEHGRVGGVVALLQAQRIFAEQPHLRVIVAGVDSYLMAQPLRHMTSKIGCLPKPIPMVSFQEKRRPQFCSRRGGRTMEHTCCCGEWALPGSRRSWGLANPCVVMVW